MNVVPPSADTGCQRCGTCCRKGGPTLHRQDRPILLAGHIRYDHLVTVRAGEPAIDPTSNRSAPVAREFVRLSGRGPDWACPFLTDPGAVCSIYEVRPLECRLLECWAPEQMTAVMGQDTLTRADLINPADPILDLIQAHDQACPAGRVVFLAAQAQAGGVDAAAALEELGLLASRDLAFRQEAAAQFDLSVGRELFVFGRPLFKIACAHGLTVQETPDGLVFHVSPPPAV
ncbi:MAG: YkgJ family cysteine cluster protein [Thermodesulfobacteriota bacterium]